MQSKTDTPFPVCPFCLVAGRNQRGATIGLHAHRGPLMKPHSCTPSCIPRGCRSCTPIVNIHFGSGVDASGNVRLTIAAAAAPRVLILRWARGVAFMSFPSSSVEIVQGKQAGGAQWERVARGF